MRTITPDIVKEWAETLYDTKMSRREIIQDLLDNSKGDEMSDLDKLICRLALTMIKDGTLYDNPPVSTRNPYLGGLDLPDELDGDSEEQE